LISVVVPSLYLVSGISAYAVANHLAVALRRPMDRVHLLFAGMRLLMFVFALAQAAAWRASDIAALTLALKLNVSVGLHMKLAVITEGVETEAQRASLVRLGCKHFQGFLFARPLPENDFRQWMAHNAYAN
jgi:hypothetical protein